MGKEEVRKLAKNFREMADILDEIEKTEDEERIEELTGRFLFRLVRLQEGL